MFTVWRIVIAAFEKKGSLGNTSVKLLLLLLLLLLWPDARHIVELCNHLTALHQIKRA